MENTEQVVDEDNKQMETVTDLIKDSKSLLDNLNQKTSAPKVTSQDDLRTNIMTFVSSQLDNIQRQDNLRSLIEAELAKKIMLHELSTSELESIYATISNEKSKNTVGLLDIFKPTNATPSSIINPPKDDNSEKIVDLTTQERQSMEKFSRIIDALTEKNKEKANKEE